MEKQYLKMSDDEDYEYDYSDDDGGYEYESDDNDVEMEDGWNPTSTEGIASENPNAAPTMSGKFQL